MSTYFVSRLFACFCARLRLFCARIAAFLWPVFPINLVQGHATLFTVKMDDKSSVKSLSKFTSLGEACCVHQSTPLEPKGYPAEAFGALSAASCCQAPGQYTVITLIIALALPGLPTM